MAATTDSPFKFPWVVSIKKSPNTGSPIENCIKFLLKSHGSRLIGPQNRGFGNTAHVSGLHHNKAITNQYSKSIVNLYSCDLCPFELNS